jgi:hypothetical protein
LTRLDSIQSDVTDIKSSLKTLNGTVHQNSQDIAILKVTSLRVDAIRVSAVIGGVAVVVGALLKAAGVW